MGQILVELLLRCKVALQQFGVGNEDQSSLKQQKDARSLASI
jgi:hypothetical protein